MSLDFTLNKYKELCEVISQNYTPITVEEYLGERPEGHIVILRHDVDRRPETALRMAEVEKEFGIRSTYYFRMRNGVFVPDIIRKIADLGHEIGYHYETLDKAKGDFAKAIEIFQRELEDFRRIYDVKTICMHGNPLTPWVNRDIWSEYDFTEFGIIGEPYISIDYSKVYYFTDTGRKWNSSFSVKDAVGSQNSVKVKSTDELIVLLENKKFERLCILTHPNRWSDSFTEWIAEFVWQNTKNIVKILIKKRR